MTRITHTFRPAGIDLRTPIAQKGANRPFDGLNFVVSPSGDLMKRPGFATKAEDSATGFGLTVYEKREPFVITVDGWGDMAWGDDEWGSPTTLGAGTIAYKLVALASVPKVWNKGTIDVTSSQILKSLEIRGSGTSDILSANVFQSSGQTQGASIDVSGTIASAASSINSQTNWTATVTSGDSTVSAKYLDYTDRLDIYGANVPEQLHFGYWSSVNTTVADPMPSTENKILEDDFENADAESMEGVLYVTNGFDAVHKYDGQTFYRAGLPAAATATVAIKSSVGAPAGLNGAYKYRVSYVQIDNIGNVVESQIASESASVTVAGGSTSIDVTIGTIADGDGYNTNCAMATGTHSSTNIASNQEKLLVDDGASGDHTLQVGDKAYFYDNTSAGYVAHNVVARTTSSITIDASATVSITDNAPISNNLRIAIYRTAGGGATFNLVAEIPNNAHASTIVYNDIIPDSSLGADLVEPDKTPGLPPACRYSAQWRNQLILGGDPQNVTRVYYSESASGSTNHANPENFPSTNFIEVGQGGGARITGLAVLGANLIVFMEDRIFSAEGNLALDQVRVDQISDSVGCVSHKSIQIFGNRLYFLHRGGVYSLGFGQGGSIGVKLESGALDPVFEAEAKPFGMAANKIKDSMRRATSAIWQDKRYYVLNLPQETFTSGELISNSDTRTIVMDIDTGEWFPWSNIHSLGGLVTFNDGQSGWLPWWITRTSGTTRKLQRMNFLNALTDYTDGGQVISSHFKSQWDFGSSPRSRKLYREVMIDRFTSGANLAFTPDAAITMRVEKDFNTTGLNSTTAIESNLSIATRSDDWQITVPLYETEKRAISLWFTESVANDCMFISGWSFDVLDYNREAKP